jgi:hypothetical protein
VEVARERRLDPLADAERAVVLDVDGDVGREQREVVSRRSCRERKNSGCGESRER